MRDLQGELKPHPAEPPGGKSREASPECCWLRQRRLIPIRCRLRPVLRRSILIVALIANAMQGDPEICLEAGMDDDMTKPFKREVLASSVGKWVHKMIA